MAVQYTVKLHTKRSSYFEKMKTVHNRMGELQQEE
jgi:hypothetical protein